MLHKIEVQVMLKSDILDPQGKTVHQSLGRLGFEKVKQVRMGKSVVLDVEAPNQDEAIKIATEAAKKLLSNPVMEVFLVRPI